MRIVCKTKSAIVASILSPSTLIMNLFWLLFQPPDVVLGVVLNIILTPETKQCTHILRSNVLIFTWIHLTISYNVFFPIHLVIFLCCIKVCSFCIVNNICITTTFVVITEYLNIFTKQHVWSNMKVALYQAVLSLIMDTINHECFYFWQWLTVLCEAHNGI